jgi:PadR family transcriptional regulator PadR
MAPRQTLGEFEHHVMLAALRLGEGAYTAPLVVELEERTGRSVSAAAVFIALRRLQERGFVTSRKKVVQAIDGRVRRYFEVTPNGLDAMRESRERFLQLWDGLGPMLER